MTSRNGPLNDVGPRDTTPEGTDTNLTICRHQATSGWFTC
jgi:hypothetical protein